MDYRHQVPPSITTAEPILSTPPPLAPPVPQVPGSSPTPPARTARRGWVVWTIIGVVIAGLLGGGYFAYSRGYVSIPFLTPKSDTLFEKMVASIGNITSAQYSLRMKLEGQPRDRNAKPLLENINRNTNSGTSLDGLNSRYYETLLKAIPADLKVEGGITIYAEADKLVQDANGLFTIDGTYTGSDVSVAVDVEMRKIQRNLYGIIRKFPSIPGFDLSGIKQKWVAITPEDSFFELSTATIESQDARKAVETAKSITKLALDEKLVTVKQRLAPETVAGVRSEHYLLEIHPDKLATVYQKQHAERKAKGDVTNTPFDAYIDALQKPEVQQLLQRIADNSRIEVWIDKTKGYLRQWRWGLTIVPGADIERLKEKQIYFGLTVTMDKVNQKVNVEKPSTTIDFDEATRLVTGISKEAQQFDKQTNRVSDVRSALTTYKSKNKQYPDTLEQLNASLKGIYAECQAKKDATKTEKTNDAQAKARDSKRKSDLAQIGTGLALFVDDKQSYPSDLNALKPDYLATIPTDPSSNAPYTYQACDGKHYVLSATLETTTEKYYYSDTTSGKLSSTAVICPAVNANTTTGGATTFSIESVGGQIGLGGYDESLYACYDEQRYRDGVNVTDIYTDKPFGYAKDGEDYKLTYQLKLTADVSSYEKDAYVDGLNTATSKDSSLEKTSSYEESQKKYEQSLKNSNTNTSNTNSSSTVRSIAPIDQSEMIRGQSSATYALVEYGDYEGPYVAQYNNTMREVMDHYDGQVKWVFRQFPLSFYKYDETASLGALCVQLHGDGTKFWRYTEALLATLRLNGSLTDDDITKAAAGAGMDAAAFNVCRQGKATDASLQAAIASGKSAGVAGTPTTFLIDSKGSVLATIAGAMSLSTVEAYLNQYVTKSVLIKDSDTDGLSDDSETYVYRTDPRKIDSDGDTYNDKAEIDNEYNPIGTGKASADQLLWWGKKATVAKPATFTGAPKLGRISGSGSNGIVTITWTTDLPADGIVNYGATASYGQYKNDTEYTTIHSIAFPVTPGQTYHFSVRSCVKNLPSTTGCTTSPDSVIDGA